MPCVKSHYINPKNVFTPKPLNPSPTWGGGVSWLRMALRTMPYPDISLVGLRVEWSWRTAP